MVFIAAFTLGYFAGVFTALLVFPPRTKEIEEQEVDALAPLIEVEREKLEKENPVFGHPLWRTP